MRPATGQEHALCRSRYQREKVSPGTVQEHLVIPFTEAYFNLFYFVF